MSTRVFVGFTFKILVLISLANSYKKNHSIMYTNCLFKEKILIQIFWREVDVMCLVFLLLVFFLIKKR